MSYGYHIQNFWIRLGKNQIHFGNIWRKRNWPCFSDNLIANKQTHGVMWQTWFWIAMFALSETNLFSPWPQLDYFKALISSLNIYINLLNVLHRKDTISYPLFVHTIQENINSSGLYHTRLTPRVIRTQTINILRIAWEQIGGNEFIT